tara:strand:- start:264551 stop:265051 length:501 start_codon:yes stop_codon:yes gene_type:complete
MPYLMIDLDDAADCRRGMQQIRMILGRTGGPGGGPDAGGGRAELLGPRGGRKGRGNCYGEGGGQGSRQAKTPLRQRLQPIKQRGVWRFVSGIAALDDTPRSLAEFDDALGVKKNKMRSMKAIFAKLEKRLDVRFLVPAEEAGEDDAGNARYRMPPRMRKVVRNLTD